MTKKEKDVALDVEVLPALPHSTDGITPHNKYSDEVRLEVVRQAIEEGKRITEIAREMGMSRDTVSAILQEIEQDIRLDAKGEDLRLSRVLGEKIFDCASALTADKLARAWPKDIAIALGVLADKRRDLLGPSVGAGTVSLRFAWKDGQGALEVQTGGNK